MNTRFAQLGVYVPVAKANRKSSYQAM
jgi:hypothetical protein